MIGKEKSRKMRRLSDKGFETLMFIALIIAIVVAIIAVNHVQEVQSREWQQEQGIQIERKDFSYE